MGNFKVYKVSTKLCVKLLLLFENVVKLTFEALKLTENMIPLQSPIHTLTLSSMNTYNRSIELCVHGCYVSNNG